MRRLIWLRAAKRHLGEDLPPDVAFAVVEFCEGPLLNEPWRVGKRLHAPLERYHVARAASEYRVFYDWNDQAVRIYAVKHRRDAYRPG